jgi:hypothetical protein
LKIGDGGLRTAQLPIRKYLSKGGIETNGLPQMINGGFNFGRVQPQQRPAKAETRLRVRPLASDSRCVCAQGKGCVERGHGPRGVHENSNCVENDAIVCGHGLCIRGQSKVQLLCLSISNAEAVERQARGLQLGGAFEQRDGSSMPPGL